MKIDYAIMGSNLNPMYLDFWPIVSKIWNVKFGITPVLGLICDEDSDMIEDEYGIVKKFKSIEGIDTGFQSQIIRFYLCKELSGNVIISDIDMAPLSEEYFLKQVSEFDENKIYIMSSDNHECNTNKEIPMCYNVSNSELFSQMLELDSSWNQFVNKLHSMNLGWTTDQRYLWNKVKRYEKVNPGKIVYLNRGWNPIADKRIDRIQWGYNPELVKEGHYIDSHLLRPYSNYKKEIDELLNYIFI